MMMLTPFHFSKGASYVFVPRFHFCIFNCKINGPETMLNKWRGSESDMQKQRMLTTHVTVLDFLSHAFWYMQLGSARWSHNVTWALRLFAFAAWPRLSATPALWRVLVGVSAAGGKRWEGFMASLGTQQFHERTSNQCNFHVLFSLC